MSKVGLYVYQIFAFDPANYNPIDFSAQGRGAQFREFLPHYIQARTTKVENNQAERTWRFFPIREEGNISEGIIKYGSFGISSTIVDRQDGGVLLDRAADDVEEIPLYFQFWVPENGSSAFIALQSFRDRSCVSQVTSDLIRSFNANRGDLNISLRKLMPAAEEVYRNAAVKRIILSSRQVPADRAEVLRRLPLEEMDVELSVSARRRGRFGTLEDVSDVIREAHGRGAFLIEEIDFDEVSALVQVGTSYMKVGIIGPNRTTGVVDITDQVAFGADGHPTFVSVAAATTEVVGTFRIAFGL